MALGCYSGHFDGGSIHNEINVDQRIFSQLKLSSINQGALFWGLQLIKANAANPQQIVDTLPQQFNHSTQEGFSIAANLEDAQSQFNLNDLSNPEYLRFLQT